MNKLVVLISGRGSNLQAIIAAQTEINAQVVAVISNKAMASGLQYANMVGADKHIVSGPDIDDKMQTIIDSYQPDLVILAGFMRILSDDFVEHYHGRLLNIHPSLLPKYKGLGTHKKVLAAGDKKHGATVHYVSAELDSGPIIMQAEVPVLADDDEESLATRVLQQEHIIYPAAIKQVLAKQGDL